MILGPNHHEKGLQNLFILMFDPWKNFSHLITIRCVEIIVHHARLESNSSLAIESCQGVREPSDYANPQCLPL